MRRSVSILSTLLAFLVSLALGVSTASAGQNCTKRLEKNLGNTLACTGVDEHGDAVAFDFTVASITGNDFKAWLEPDGSDEDVALDCACKSKGKKGKTKFEVKKSFACVSDGHTGTPPAGDFDYDSPTAYEGRVNKKGTKIGAGQGVDLDGVSISFSCSEPVI